jgi:hypothetical protein
VGFLLRIYLVSTYERGSLVGKGLRSEVPEEHQGDFRLGIASETSVDSEGACRRVQTLQESFQLSGDKSDAVHTFSRTDENSGDFEFNAGIKVFDLDLSSKTKVSRTNKLKLTFQLSAGRDYILKRAKDGSGIWWK